MSLIGNTSNNAQLASTAAKLLSGAGAALARTEEAKALADNPFTEYVEYTADYENIVKQGVDKIYKSNNPQLQAMQTQQYIQQAPMTNYPMQQQMNMQYVQPQIMQYPQQMVFDNNYIQQQNQTITTVDISKYTGQKKKQEKVPENLSQLQTLNKANEPIIARLEGLLEIMGLLFQEQQKTNELLALGFGVGESMNSDYDDELTEADVNAAEDYIDKIDSQSKSFEEEEAELTRLSQSLTPPPSPDVVDM